MAVEQFSNNAQTTLNGAISNSTTTIVVNSNAGFPSAAQFRIIIDSEIMLVTAGQAGLTWTVTRGNNLTAPDVTVNATHANNATITHILTAGGLTNYTLNPVSGASWAASTLLTLGSIANNYGLVINGPSGAGTSFGIKAVAGTNSTDYAARFQTQAAVDILAARGDGIVIIGGAPAQINMTGTGQAKIVGGTTGGVISNNANNANNFSWTDAGLLTMRNAIAVPPSAAGTVAGGNYGSLPVKIAEVILGASAANITFASIPGGFRNLELVTDLRGDGAVNNDNAYFQFNGDTATASYESQQVQGANATASAAQTFQTVGAINTNFAAGANSTAGTSFAGRMLIINYAGTTFQKQILAIGGGYSTNATTGGISNFVSGRWLSTAAITQILIKPNTSANWIAGSSAFLYGWP